MPPLHIPKNQLEKGIHSMDTLGGKQQLIIMREILMQSEWIPRIGG
jgi:hypothetical protein